MDAYLRKELKNMRMKRIACLLASAMLALSAAALAQESAWTPPCFDGPYD